MLTVAIANESAARVRRVMFAAARRQVTQAWLVGTLVTATTSLYSFLHSAKRGFLFILKNVLFKEINDTEIPITFSKKMI